MFCLKKLASLLAILLLTAQLTTAAPKILAGATAISSPIPTADIPKAVILTARSDHYILQAQTYNNGCNPTFLAHRHKEQVVENECHNFKQKGKNVLIRKSKSSKPPSNWRCKAALWSSKGCEGEPTLDWHELVMRKHQGEYTDSTCIGGDEKAASIRFYCE